MGYPVPDLDVSRDGARHWVEVKTKARASPYWKAGGRLDHGVDYSLVQHYQTVEKITGTECWIAIYEESTGDLLCQSLDRLGEPRRATDRGTPMAYWPRTAFRLMHTFTEEADE